MSNTENLEVESCNQELSEGSPPASPASPEGSTEGGSSNDDDEVVEKKRSSSDQEELIPVPPPVPKNGISLLAHKLWIGNLDKRLNEQNILRFVMKHGNVVSFRFLFKTGPERPEQRDYVFVEYSTREEAEKAKTALDGKKALGKRIIADWARQDQGAAKKNQHAVSETWDASAVSETLGKTVGTSAKIAALEAKLKQMEEGSLDRGPIRKKQRLSFNLRQSRPQKKSGATALNPIHRRRPPRQSYMPIRH